MTVTSGRVGFHRFLQSKHSLTTASPGWAQRLESSTVYKFQFALRSCRPLETFDARMAHARERYAPLVDGKDPGIGTTIAEPVQWHFSLGTHTHTHTHTHARTHAHTHAHTHTHTFNGPLSRTTPVSRYQIGKTNLDFTEARDSEW